ncbi:MAG TPA: hypothetical protein VH643_35205, partial [Gemmataceae bacterium]
KGDFFFYKTPYFQAAGCPLPSQEFFDGFLRSLPDVPEYHRTIETFYKLEATPHFIAEELDPKAPKVACRMPKCTTASMRLRLSPRMIKAYPITWDMHHFFADDVFALIEEDFDWDFFVRDDLRLKLSPPERAEALRTPHPDPRRFLEDIGAEILHDNHAPGCPVFGVSLPGSASGIDVPLTEDVLRALEKLPSCTYLSTSIPPQGLGVFTRLPQLRDLSLDPSEGRPAEEFLHGLKEIARLPQLTGLCLAGTTITDSALEELAPLGNLEELNLGGTRVTDAGLAHLTRLPQLRSLDLTDTRVTDKGVPELVKLEHLIELDLSETRVTNQSFGELARLPRLEKLNVSADGVTDAGLAYLRNAPSLKRIDVPLSARGDNWLSLQVKFYPQADILDLRNSFVTDAGLSELAKLGQLRVLHLSGTKITDAGLKTLATIGSLCKINLAKTQVTDAGLIQLMALPNLVKVKLSASAKGDNWLRLLVKIAPDTDEVDASRSRITLEGLQVLTGLPKLYGLFLLNLPLTDEAVPVLSRLRQVGFLNLRGTKLTRRGVAALQKALPKCNIGTDWDWTEPK